MSRPRTETSATKSRILRTLMLQMSEIQKLEVCQRIQEARREAGLTQEEAADLVGVSTRAWQTWEADVIPYRRIGEIADVLGTTKRQLLHGDESPPPAQDQTELLRKMFVEIEEIRKRLDGGGEEERGDRG